MSEYLRLAKFDLVTHDREGNQFGFGIMPDPTTGKNRLSGHIDGVILSRA